MKKSKIFKSIIIIFSILIISALGYILWSKDNYKPSDEALSVLKSQELIEVEEDEFITFKPKDKTAEKGFIFYPGAKVSPESYSLLAKGIAEEGYLVVIVPMPLDLAILSPNKAEEVIQKYNDIDIWAIGGHSLGGVMASKFASSHDDIKGLALYASYPSGDELIDSSLEVVSIYGSEDGVANLEKIKNAFLPKDSVIFEIEGGNHAQFGDYGNQKGDNDAIISEKKQLDITENSIVNFLDNIK